MMMHLGKVLLAGLGLSLSSNLAQAQDPRLYHIKAMALAANGAVAGGLAPKDWTVKVDGKPVALKEVLPPSEVSKRPVKWAFILLPVRDPAAREVALLAITTFLKTLPSSDAVLLVNQGKKGLECLTPGFTRRPSLWVAGLERAEEDFQAGLHSSAATFTLPETPAGEAREGKETLLAFAAKLGDLHLKRQAEDTRSHHFKENYVEAIVPGVRAVTGARFHALPSYSSTIEEALASLDRCALALGKVPGELQVVVFSRSELDDLGSPLWQSDSGVMEVNDMLSRIGTARAKSLKAFVGQGLTVHSVTAMGLCYLGAFGDLAPASGGFVFSLAQDLPGKLTQVLGGWANRYELTFALPEGTPLPAKLEVEGGPTKPRLFVPNQL